MNTLTAQCNPNSCGDAHIRRVGAGFANGSIHRWGARVWDSRRSGTAVRMDAITLLKNDHKTVERLFKQFEKAGDRALVEKRRIVDRIIEELSVHASIEEQYFYPATRATVPETEDIVLESLEEHHIVK